MNDSGDQKAKCPECGRKIGRGLGGHKGSKRCRAYQEMNKVQERGLTELPNEARKSSELRERIKQYGRIERYKTNYVSGSRNQRSKLKKKAYTTPDALREARREYLPNPRGRSRVDRAEIVEHVEHGQRAYVVVARETTRPASNAASEFQDRFDEYRQVRELLAVTLQQPDEVEGRRVLYVPKNERAGMLRAYNGDGELVGVVRPGMTRTVMSQTSHGSLEMSDGERTRYFIRDSPVPIDLSAAHAVKPTYNREVVTRDDIDDVKMAEELNGDAVALATGDIVPMDDLDDDRGIEPSDLAESYDPRAAKRRPEAVTGVYLESESYQEETKLVLESGILTGESSFRPRDSIGRVGSHP